VFSVLINTIAALERLVVHFVDLCPLVGLNAFTRGPSGRMVGSELPVQPEPQILGHASHEFDATSSSVASPTGRASMVQGIWWPRKLTTSSCLSLREGGKCLCFLVKVTGGLGLATSMVTAFIDWRVVEDSTFWRTRLLTAIFICSLLFVALEDVLEINKSSVMLLSAGVMWSILAVSDHPDESIQGADMLNHQVQNGLEEIGKILLFLLPAMGVCESIDHFNGFALVARAIRCTMAGSRERLMPIICLMTFVLCIVVDSMSATIVSLKILRRLVPDDEFYRRQCGALVVLGANACVWSPIGEVTTAMLWIAGRITPRAIAVSLILPSLASLILPLGIIWGSAVRRNRLEKQQARSIEMAKGPSDSFDTQAFEDEPSSTVSDPLEIDHDMVPVGQVASEKVELLHETGPHPIGVEEKVTFSNVTALCLGISCILMVPVLKWRTELPPYFGMLFVLGLMWAVTDALSLQPRAADANRDIHKSGGTSQLGVIAALHKIDLGGLLFFAGVLQSVAALDAANILRGYAELLSHSFGDSPVAISIFLGLSSALVDNVPLVQAAIDMFAGVEVDAPLWQLVALAAGTGGSLLSTGGIAGVTFMGMEGISFIWYCKNVSVWAVAGFFSGIAVYQLQTWVVGQS